METLEVETTTTPPLRHLLVFYCGAWTLFVSIGAAIYAGWLLLGDDMHYLGWLSLLVSALSIIQATSGFYYLKNYIMIGVNRGWTRLLESGNISRAPRKSLLTWILSSMTLALCFGLQVGELLTSNQDSMKVIFGSVFVALSFIGFMGIIAGLILSGIFGSVPSESEEARESSQRTSANRVGVNRFEEVSPRRRK
jgi:hypothetical protein